MGLAIFRKALSLLPRQPLNLPEFSADRFLPAFFGSEETIIYFLERVSSILLQHNLCQLNLLLLTAISRQSHPNHNSNAKNQKPLTN